MIKRNNNDCLTDERVFDEADLLSDAQEQALREQIALAQEQCHCDIVLVTLNQEISGQWEGIRDWADDFYDNNAFGYNKPHGDGAVLVDNWYSFGDYNGDMWLSTSGKAEDKYSSSDIDDLLDDVCEDVNDDPYKAYSIYVEEFTKHMRSGTPEAMKLPWFLVALISVVIAVLYFFINYYTKPAKDTTTPYTYVTGGKPIEESRRDTFITKTVHKRKIETSSSSGGGGHHISSGGFSHGGGGHHH
ncbi:MAG: TPM domain-containing protein [Lachnospiraceae bacterium]|nr:TPM domain-containing protein [Lachnospiraceae bacterium]